MKDKKNQIKKQHFDDEDANLDYMDFPDNKDPEYLSMLPQNGKMKSNSYFLQSKRYSGRVKESDEQQYSEEESEQNKKVDESNEINHAISQIKNQRKIKSKLLEEDLRLIEEEDREVIVKMKNTEDLQSNSSSLKNQLKEFSKLVEIRYFSQKNLQQIKKYPTDNFPNSHSLHQAHKKAESASLSSLAKLVENYQQIAIKTFYNSGQGESQLKISKIPIEQIEESKMRDKKQVNIGQLWEKFEQETKELNKKLEHEIISWSQRTTLLKNSSNKSHYNSLLMQTPIGQANKAIKDWEKVSKKCQLKRTPFRIYFKGEEDLGEAHNRSIYDDLDLMQQVQKTYEQEVENEDKDFLIEDTLKYIENRSNKIKKDVDRKASKNRKIRYNVHTKLLNFMPCQGENMLEAHEEIVQNLFNHGGSRQIEDREEEMEYIDM